MLRFLNLNIHAACKYFKFCLATRPSVAKQQTRPLVCIIKICIEIRKIENIRTATIRKKAPFVKCFFLNILPKSIDIEVQKHAKRLDDYLLSQFLNFLSIQLGY